MTEGAFFQDLAILMTIAGVAAVVFARMGWPKVLGYILAGIIMNEHTWGGSFLVDVGSTRTIGQLGVVFLMFGMGLSFSSSDMRRIRTVAIPAAVLDTLVMTWLGYTIGTRVFGWGSVASIFLGVAICDSATTLLAKVIGELHWSDRPFAKFVMGTSVCEDIFCVGASAVAIGFATSGTMSASALFGSLGWLFVFFLTVLVVGFIFLPRLLRSVAKRNDDELLVLTILGCCFFVSYLAYRFDYSLALGAFLVGIVGASSGFRERLSGLTAPLKAMFSAVFFVSIGLLVDPSLLLRFAPEILLVSAVVVVGKLLNVFVASILTGLDVKTSVQNGFSLAQIGEFAFLVAILYESVVRGAREALFPVAVGASLLTTLLNPPMIIVSDRIGDWVAARLPLRVRELLDSYRVLLEKIGSANDFLALRIIRVTLIKLGIYAVLLLSSMTLCAILHQFDYSRFSQFFERHDELIFFLLSNLFAVALLPMVVFTARSLGDEVSQLLVGKGQLRWQQVACQLVRFVILLAVLFFFFAEWSMLNIAFSPHDGVTIWVTIAVSVLVAAIGWRYFIRAGLSASHRLVESLTAEERREGIARTMTITMPEGTLQRLPIGPTSPAVGNTVVTLNIRAKTGASVVSVFRGGVLYRNIGPEWEFAIDDVLVVLGEPAQIAALKDLLGITA